MKSSELLGPPPFSFDTPACILVVDDEEANLRLLERLLRRADIGDVICVQDAREVQTAFLNRRPDLILLDLQMPFVDGFEVLAQIECWKSPGEYLPVLVLTADVSRETRERALSSGALDFLTKPLDTTEVILRSRNLLHTRFLNRHMDRLVRERTEELEASRIEVLERLARTAEFRDDDTGKHTRRVGELASLIAERLHLEAPIVDRIGRAAPLHDLGKVGIPDQILLKPGRLTPEEFEVIKSHTTVGAELLAGGRSELIQMAERIALAHHERWDGTGYPQGLAGMAIPIEARIVAAADFFDALTHDRPYRAAVPLAEVLDEIRRLSGSHFDPAVADALLDLLSTRDGLPE